MACGHGALRRRRKRRGRGRGSPKNPTYGRVPFAIYNTGKVMYNTGKVICAVKSPTRDGLGETANKRYFSGYVTGGLPEKHVTRDASRVGCSKLAPQGELISFFFP